MISITSSRIKKALLHPREAFLYVKNYLKGEIIRQKCKHPIFLRVNLKRILGKKIYSNLQKYFLLRKQPHFFTEDHYFLEEITNQDFIISTANRILRQEFGFLGLIPKTIKVIDWNEDIRSGHHLPILFIWALLIFGLFDALKPFPANVSQKLPGGWGIVLDDVIVNNTDSYFSKYSEEMR